MHTYHFQSKLRTTLFGKAKLCSVDLSLLENLQCFIKAVVFFTLFLREQTFPNKLIEIKL